jgi:hypothetical protein
VTGVTGEEVLLAVGLGAPLVGTLVVLAFGSSAPGRRLLQIAALISAGAWAGLLGTSSVVRLGAFHAGPLVASAASGAALLLVSVDLVSGTRERRPGRVTLVAASLGLVSLDTGLAAGAGGGHGGALVGGLAAAAIFGLIASWDQRRVAGVLTPPAVALGVGATVVGIVLVHDKTNEWLLPAVGSATVPRNAVIALMVGAAGLCIAGGLRPGRSTVILMAGGLGVGLRAGPLLGLSANVAPAAPGTSEGLVGLVLALAVVAVVAALLRKPPLAISLLAVAVAAGPLTLLPASRLLAAAAVLALAIDRAPAWLLVVPGTAALVIGAIEAGSTPAIVCVGAVATVGAVVAGVEYLDRARPAGTASRPFDILSVPAILAGGWLLLAPASWTWAGAQGLHYYDIGAARAGAAGLIVTVLTVAWWNRRVRTDPELAGRPEPEAPELVRSGRSAP